MLFPFIDQGPAYNQLDFTVRINQGNNPAVLNGLLLNALLCPSDPNSGLFNNNRLSSTWNGPGTTHGGKSMGQNYAPSAGPINMNECPFGTAGDYSCKGSNGGAWTNGAPGLFAGGNVGYRFRDCTDGLSNTFLLGEQLPLYDSLMMYFSSHLNAASTHYPPNQHRFDTTNCVATPDGENDGSQTYERCAGFKSIHSGGLHMAMGDGGVKFFSENIDYRTWQYLGDKADGEVVQLPN